MNGAEALIHTAVACGAEVCFTNPGTTEIELVKAMDAVAGMRPVLGLFEGVCTAAADGYARMAERPVVTLLHLGPGLANGIANLHNARRAKTPIVNVVGDHVRWHLEYDAPLTADIDSLAHTVSAWVRHGSSGKTLARDTAEAFAAALTPPGQIATLIVPMDCCSEESDGPAAPIAAPLPKRVADKTIGEIVQTLRSSKQAVLYVGGGASRERGLKHANRIAAASGCRLVYATFTERVERGAGAAPIERLPYFPDAALEALAGVDAMIVAGTKPPVSFFGYEGFPSILVPEGCAIHTLAAPEEDAVAALEAVADGLGAAPDAGGLTELDRPGKPTGALTPEKIGAALGALLPEGAIVSDEALSPGAAIEAQLLTAPRHTVLYLTGGAIGQGLPAATGAAIACPDRPVVALESDGCGLYTLQSFWTQAREGLDVTNIILANRTYEVLRAELRRAGVAEFGPKTTALTDISHPEMDWSSISRGFGVPAVRTETAEAFYTELQRAFAEPGPHLIEALI